MVMGNNGLYDPLFHCWITLGMEGDDGMEVMASGGLRLIRMTQLLSWKLL